MRLKVKVLATETGGKLIVTLSKEDAEELGVKSGGRVKIKFNNNELTAVADVVTHTVRSGLIGMFDEVQQNLKVNDGDIVEVEAASFPKSLSYIRSKLNRRPLTYDEIYQIVKDVIDGNLSESEIATFITALETIGLDLEETYNLTVAMVNTGGQLKFDKQFVVDKHSIGGVPGDKTSLILVPIVAAGGLTIPKSSSRAITSASGTADRAEALMPVDLDLNEMQRVVNETNGCLVWGGALHLAPADDIFVQIEYPLQIDPLMLPSIMSKKRAVGSKFLIIDLPTGRGSKMKTIGNAELVAKDFIELGRRLGIQTQCAITYGEQPLGNSIGPNLEAKETLEVLMNKKSSPDLIDKVTHLAGMLFEMTGKNHGRNLALEILKNGKAEKKMREIIYQQGGDSEVKPEDLKIGEYGLEIKAEHDGLVLWIDNNLMVEIARAAGSPKDKEAGIVLHKKVGHIVKKGEPLFTIYATKTSKLKDAEKILETNPIGVGDRHEMLIGSVKETPKGKRAFILER